MENLEIIEWTLCPECGEESFQYQLTSGICEHCGCEIAEWKIEKIVWVP